MPVIYVAKSQALQKWGAEVGLGKHVYKVGIGEGSAVAVADALNAEALAGQADWKVLKAQELDEPVDEQAAIARLATREKEVDPNFYPKLRGARGVFKVKLENVSNHFLVQQAFGTGSLKVDKMKPADIAQYLIVNTLE